MALWNCPLVILTDSLSLLSALARGPCRQREWHTAEVWKILLDLARMRKVIGAFVFAHCGFKEQDDVDEAAKAAVALHLDDQPPIWWKDGARVLNNRICSYFDSRAREEGWRGCSHPSGAPSKPPRLPRYRATPLCRLRCGVEPKIGGWRHRFVDPCPRCGEQLTRDAQDPPKYAVDHFLSCPLATGLRQLQSTSAQWTPASLWKDEHWPQILDYWQDFVRQ